MKKLLTALLCLSVISISAQVTPKATLKQYFKNGAKPPQEQFWNMLDSYWHKSEKIPIDSIKGLDSALNQHIDEADPFFAANGVPKTRTITINGETKPLTDNVDFTVTTGAAAFTKDTSFTPDGSTYDFVINTTDSLASFSIVYMENKPGDELPPTQDATSITLHFNYPPEEPFRVKVIGAY